MPLASRCHFWPNREGLSHGGARNLGQIKISNTLTATFLRLLQPSKPTQWGPASCFQVTVKYLAQAL